jgi:hypothetical protein
VYETWWFLDNNNDFMRFSYSLHHHIIALYSCATHTAERRNALTKIKRPGWRAPWKRARAMHPGDSDPFETRTMCPETLCVGTRGPSGRSGRHARRAPRFRGDVRAPKWFGAYRSTLRKGSRPKILARSTCRYLQPISNCMITLCRPKSQR